MKTKNIFKKYIGDRGFYKQVLAIAVPIMVQNGITNLVNLLDNIMVGTLGTEEMAGVSIVNQFIFIFNLLVFGSVSAAGIFTAQFHGVGDREGIRHTFRFKLLIIFFAATLGIGVFLLFDDFLINLFLHNTDNVGDLTLALKCGKDYLFIMLFGLLPYAISQVYASTMRETEVTVPPMFASVIAVFTNFVLNILLIFGFLGFPALGIKGAAIATVISRFCELLYLVVYAHVGKNKSLSYFGGIFKSLKIPAALAGKIAVKGIPIIFNEFFWALAMTLRNQCYSTRGLDVVAAQNINSTLTNLFSVVYMSMSSAIAIMIGSLLGAGKLEEAKDKNRKLIAFAMLCSIIVAALLSASAPLFPLLYNTSDGARELATYMILITAATMPFAAYTNAAYFTLRSGGQVMITLLFDSVFMWSVVMPISASLAYFTNMNIHMLFLICQGTEVIKASVGAYLLHRGTWVKTLVKSADTVQYNTAEAENQ